MQSKHYKHMKKLFLALVALCTLMLFVPSCGEPNNPPVVNPGDTIPENPGDTVPGDTIPEEPTVPDSIVFTIFDTRFVMIKVEGGTFMMGAPDSDQHAGDNEKPAHSVTLSSYYIGQTEVTQQLWEEVMDTYPAENVGVNFPVESVSWNDCQGFINRLNQFAADQLNGMHFRLPTEAEWEYAARGGNQSQGYLYSGSNNVDEVAWYTGNSNGSIHNVKQKLPNELGLYDMTGNVWEWCFDYFEWEYYSVSPSVNPQGPSEGRAHAIRGGSCNCTIGVPYYDARCTYRYGQYSDFVSSTIGLRIVLSE